jgi:tRNA(fMet)-specific endonuclease VapC
MRYLVDTDWAVWWLRGRPEFVEQLRTFRQDGLAISAVTLAELETGVRRSRERVQGERVLRLFLRRVAVLPFTAAIAQRFGEENARLLESGVGIGQFDLAIAATALSHNLVVLTENRKHYERIPALKIHSLQSTP